ncbi:MAG: GTP 3',8-cyclase MoaA [Gammaproteobacteria bacterium]|nr:GTP 3',8-cyclase MoaA [Gammaproteobacteria bacterium]
MQPESVTQPEHVLQDPFGRRVEYLRLSVTDRCNYRCFYCMPEQGVHLEPRANILRSEELVRLVAAFVALGVRRVRITGGEPLVRRNLVGLVVDLAALPGLDDLSLTTNGDQLERSAADLVTAGLDRVNVSLDSLDPDTFRDITRGGRLDRVLAGIERALDVGLAPVKLNMVVMGGLNDGEIEAMVDYATARGCHLRFIETMPVGVSGAGTMGYYYSAQAILDRVRDHCGEALEPATGVRGGGPASYFRAGRGTVGVISAMSRHFCDDCNRVRLTAKGDLVLCLGREDAVPLGRLVRDGADDAALREAIVAGIARKPRGHGFTAGEAAGAVPMSVTGG